MEEEGEDDDDDEEEAPKTEARRKKKKMMENEEESSEEEEEVSIEEIIRALREGEDEEEAPAAEEKAEEELEEAYKVIKFLRAKLNEVNLLNAKLLYVNKLFKKANLTESKKMKVVETFDRVKSVREAKLVYATLCESLAAASVKKPVKTNKTSLKESFASRASKGTRVINESNQVVNRFKELVNYNKNNF
jgi:prolyl oligopeptidase PreP (S9A serine peptidase family)